MYNRWQRALQIAEILCEQEGYHTRYLHEIDDFLQRTYDTARAIPHVLPCGVRPRPAVHDDVL
jgi:hypothetical protein